MAGRFSQATIEEVQRASDIVEVISSYVPLKRAGKDHKACCPFHGEKVPSFYVSPAKQIFKCFGCGKGGSVFQFVMARENVTFPEAVRLLADRAGIRLPEAREAERGPQGPDRNRVLKTLAWATQVFERLLGDAEGGRAAREYLAERGFTDETSAAFRLGLAADSWDTLLRAAQKRGVSTELLEAAGLVVPRSEGGGHYDRFRHRLMFPIFDTLNRPIAFGGRALGDDPAKYLNSPDTAVFDKSRNLYGLPQAREAMAQSRQVIVVEGYTDCLMAQQVGVANVVATLGTSLTRDHVRLLRRYVDEVVLIFDGDLAGQNAADRAVGLFLQEEVNVRIVTLAEDADPCDFLARGNKDAFLEMVAEAPDALEYKWRLVRRQFAEADSVRGRRRALEAMLEALAAQPAWLRGGDGLKRDLVLARMAATLGVDERSLRERLGRLARQASASRQYDEADEVGPEAGRNEPVRADDLRSRAERLMLAALLAMPDRIAATSERFAPASVRRDEHRRLYEALIRLADRLEAEGLSVLWSHLADSPAAALAADLAETGEIAGAAEDDAEARRERAETLLEDALAALRRLGERDDVAAVRGELAASKTEGERRDALRKLQELRKDSGGFLPPGMTGREAD